MQKYVTKDGSDATYLSARGQIVTDELFRTDDVEFRFRCLADDIVADLRRVWESQKDTLTAVESEGV